MTSFVDCSKELQNKDPRDDSRGKDPRGASREKDPRGDSLDEDPPDDSCDEDPREDSCDEDPREDFDLQVLTTRRGLRRQKFFFVFVVVYVGVKTPPRLTGFPYSQRRDLCNQNMACCAAPTSDNTATAPPALIVFPQSWLLN
jgi:hypothetical protein